jgi:acetolactate synthase-1/2/3 large subunit
MSANKKKSVAEIIVDALMRHGVEVMFSQSLPSAVLLAAEKKGLTQFMYRTENAGAVMADGYARTSGKVGVVSAQNGPAATLLVPGLAEALKVSVPIVALVQDVVRAQADRNAFQEFDHIALFQSCTKWVRRVTEASRVVDYIDMAFANAASGRPGPVALILPADLLLEEIGGGVHLSGASDAVAAIQRDIHIPVMTTVMGKGVVDESHALSIGVTGYAMGKLSPTRYMRPIIEEADVILMVGTRTNQNGTDSWALYPENARYIHIDVDGAEIGRNYEALRLFGDAKLTLEAIYDKLKGRRGPAQEVEQSILEARQKHSEDITEIEQSDSSPIRPERMAADIRQVLSPDMTLVADASYATLWVACYLPSLKHGMRFITPRGLAGLGWGLPLAIGAKVACPESPVLCMVGDGGFAHVWSELETAARRKTPIVLTVLNNSCLGYQKDAEDVKFGSHTTACYFTPVDHAAIARASGCRGVRIDKASDYLPALREALDCDETTVLDVITDPAAYPPVTFFDGLDDIRRSR